jgi:hypothetical protein
MENNYLLKHRQQQHEVENWPTSSMIADLARTRHDYYTRAAGRSYTIEDPMVMPHRPSLPIVPGGRRFPRALPPRLSRVRSEELLGTRSEPDLRPPILDDEENCRWFVALFDYDHHMSPNPNAQQEELSFRKHQLIKVQHTKDIRNRVFALIHRHIQNILIEKRERNQSETGISFFSF